MRPQREPQGVVVLHNLLAFRHGRKDGFRLVPLAALARGLEQRQRRSLGEGADLPQRLATIESHGTEGVGGGQGLDGGDRYPGAPANVPDTVIAHMARIHDALRVFLSQAADLAHAETQGMVPAGQGFQTIVPPARVDVDGADLDAVPAGVAHDLGGGVEAHGLGVQQRAGEYIGMPALQP